MCNRQVISHLGFLVYIVIVVHGRSLERTTRCRDGFDERLINVPGTDRVEKRCCHPISHCGPGHEVVDCSVDHGEDQCQACPRGLVQPEVSSSYSKQLCVQSSLTCAEEAVEREVAGIRVCQCDAERGYCGLPTDCKIEAPCNPGLFLHHESCQCVAVATNPTVTSATVASGPPMTTPLTVLPPAVNNQGLLETTSKDPLILPDGTPSKADAGVIFSTTTSPSPAFAINYGILTGAGIAICFVFLVMVVIFFICKYRASRSFSIRQGTLIIYNKITSIANLHLSRSTGNRDNSNDAEPAAPEDAENDETVPKSARPVCQEECRGHQEEEGPGANPNKPMLEQPSDYVPLNPTL